MHKKTAQKTAIAFLRLAGGKALSFDEEREIVVYLSQQDEKIVIFFTSFSKR